MNYKCIKKGRFNLTVGKVYEHAGPYWSSLIRVKVGSYIRSYPRAYFIKVDEVVKKVVEKPKEIQLSFRNNQLYAKYGLITQSFVTYGRLNISCGINEFHGINNMSYYCEMLPKEIQVESMYRLIYEVVNYKSYGMTLMSTNYTNNKYFNLIEKGFAMFNEKHPDMLHTTKAYNPNSDNNIILYTVIRINEKA